MNKKEKTSLVPKLRFPEFRSTGEWEIITLNNLARKITVRNKDNLINRVLTNSAVEGVVDQSDYFDREVANQNNLENYFVIDEGDYVYNPRISVTAPVGPISKNKVGRGVMSPLYTVFRFENPNNDFYEQYFKTSLWHSYLKRVSNTGARHDRMSISNGSFMKMPLPYHSQEEQQKIADCLSSLDDLIAAEVKKLEALKAHKKGLMQKLFPAKGKTVPEWRFPEFRDGGEWENKKLDDLCEFTRGPFGGALKKEIFVKDGYAVYEQSHAIYNNFDSFRYFITEEKFNELKRFSVHTDDIIMSCSGTLGKFSIVPKESRKGIINQALLKLTVKKGFDLRFIKNSLELPINQEKLLSQSAGGAIKNVVSVDQIKKNYLCIPNTTTEQQKISDCLSSIDDCITAQADKIEALQAHKKGLMQGLFPSIKEVGE